MTTCCPSSIRPPCDCPVCGSDIPEDVGWCPECGYDSRVTPDLGPVYPDAPALPAVRMPKSKKKGPQVSKWKDAADPVGEIMRYAESIRNSKGIEPPIMLPHMEKILNRSAEILNKKRNEKGHK